MIARYWNSPGYGLRTHFEELDRMKRHLDQIFSQVGQARPTQRSAGVYPLLNLTETKDAYIIRAELPGVTAETLDIQATGRNISITGERRIPVDRSAKYHRREREAGRFSRALTLPSDIDRDRIEATLKDGVLKITLNKSEQAKPKQIRIS